jgi:hypothetical protein
MGEEKRYSLYDWITVPASRSSKDPRPESYKVRSFEEKWQKVSSQGDLFRSEYKELGFLPYDVKLTWRCSEGCSECRNRPHDMKVLDWGLLELGRRDGWEQAKERMATLSDLSRYDFRLFMGNFRNHLKTFGVIGMWYPKIPEQPSLL